MESSPYITSSQPPQSSEDSNQLTTSEPFIMHESSAGPLPTNLTVRLYTSHLFSTWNSRLFEFGAVLFLADIFPGSLLPLSIYALVRNAAAIRGAQAVGDAVDGAGRSGKRLNVVRLSIVAGRISVAGSCAICILLDHKRGERHDWRLGTDAMALGLFVILVALACVEKLSSVMNLVAVERDWVVVMTEGNEDARRSLNSQMRRLDLLCKLLGPLAISSIAIVSTPIAIWTTLVLNLVSMLPEYFCIARVHALVPSLRHPSSSNQTDTNDNLTTRSASVLSRIIPLTSLSFYIRHPAFLPSLSLSLLYLTVLSLSGQMVTYLLASGFTPVQVGLIRTMSTVFELSATFLAPWLMSYIGVVRAGIWSLSWEMGWLALGGALYFRDTWLDNGQDEQIGVNLGSLGLVASVVLSRVGLWGFDLCAQSIVQDEVEAENRGSFSSVEAAFQNLFELASYVTTIIFSRPDQFKWPVAVSIGAVYLAGGLYAGFVRKRRGHLFHRPACVCLDKGRHNLHNMVRMDTF